MSIYNVTRYGEDFYGAPPLLEFEVRNFEAVAVKHNSLRVSWTSPAGDDWEQIRLVRSSSGHPEYVDAGVILVDAPSTNAPAMYIDEPLTGGFHYHYVLFVLPTDTSRGWVEVARTTGLAMLDHDYSGRMWNLLPETYHQSDSDLGNPGPLQRFITLFGYQADYLRTELDTLRNINNMDRVAVPLLPLHADQLGTTIENELGAGSARRYLRNAVYLYRRKGTIKGIEGLVSALTGWRAIAAYNAVTKEVDIDLRADRVNMLPNPTFFNDVNFWTGTNATVTHDATVGWGSQAGAAKMVSSGAGQPSLTSDTITLYSDASITNQYQVNMRVLTSNANRSARMSVTWLDIRQDVMRVDQSDLKVLTASTTFEDDKWATLSMSPQAPLGARFAIVSVVFETVSVGTYWVDAVILEPSLEEGDYFDGSVLPAANYLWEGSPHASSSHYYQRRLTKDGRVKDVLPEYLPIGTVFNLIYGAAPPVPPALAGVTTDLLWGNKTHVNTDSSFSWVANPQTAPISEFNPWQVPMPLSGDDQDVD